ncbi:helix-turn-helix domain-containing protein [Chitinophaga silvisoli]|uniref:helix-turn-helix domain-containing protein n=1 Tax=Chitinophaga silvisoli TaxID=2291814 RepID=UPI003742FEA1
MYLPHRHKSDHFSQRVLKKRPRQPLTRKPRQPALHQLSEKNRKPADIYLESGFDAPSHFPFTFKKQYGYSPKKIVQQS